MNRAEGSRIEVGYLRRNLELRVEPYFHPGKHEIHATLVRHPVITLPPKKKWCVIIISWNERVVLRIFQDASKAPVKLAKVIKV